MKTILVLTDFSDNSTTAALTGLIIAEKLHARLLVVHNMSSIPVTPYYIGGGFVAEEAGWLAGENRDRLQILTRQLEANAARGDAGYKTKINTQLTEGDLAENLRSLTAVHKIEMVVIGGKSGGSLDHLLFGYDTRAVIEHAMCPVLVVPKEHALKKINKVIFATNFNESDQEAIKSLVKWGAIFDFQLEIVHISPFGQEQEADEAKELAFVDQMGKLKYPRLMYKDVRGKDIVTRLAHLSKESHADLLAIVHYQHSYFSGLLKDSHTKKALQHQQLPILIFHGGKVKV